MDDGTKTATVVHSYDTQTRRILCGAPGQMNSTKHPAGVSCRDCRELLREAMHPSESASEPQ
jgi:hypothetical protein